MAKKELMSFRLDPATIALLHDMVEAGDARSYRDFIEQRTSDWIFRKLEPLYCRASLRPSMSHAELCELYLKHRRAMRGEKYFQIVYGKDQGWGCCGTEPLSLQMQKLLLKYYQAQDLKIARILSPGEADNNLAYIKRPGKGRGFIYCDMPDRK